MGFLESPKPRLSYWKIFRILHCCRWVLAYFSRKKMGTCLTKGFNFHSEKLWEIDVSDITTFLLNLNIGKQSALSKLSNRYRGYPLSPKKLLGFAPIPRVHLAEAGGPDPWTPLASYAAASLAELNSKYEENHMLLLKCSNFCVNWSSICSVSD